MPIGPARMPLLEHLSELRMRVVRMVVVVFVFVIIYYFAAPTAIDFLMEPFAEFLDAGELTTLTLFEGFGVRFKVALWMGVVACMPIILWEILAFFLPALKPNERKWFNPTFGAGVGLFIVGTVFCYLVILRPAFQWLIEQSGSFAEVQAQASSFTDSILLFEVGFGLAFELPLVIFYLVLFDIVPYKRLRSSWRVVYIVLLVVSAMVTPDASPVTMLLMFAALVVLYEGSLLVARIALMRRLRRQQKEREELGEDAPELEEGEEAPGAWLRGLFGSHSDDEDEEEA